MTESFTDCVQFHWQRRRGEIIDHFRRPWAAPELPTMETQAAVGLSDQPSHLSTGFHKFR